MRYFLLLVGGLTIVLGSIAIADVQGLSEADKAHLIQQLQIARGQATAGEPIYPAEMPIKCGQHLSTSWRQLEAELDPQLYKALDDRPVRHTFWQTEHFRVHYDTSGIDAPPMEDIILEPGVPDYVDSIALIMERVWTYTIDTLGYIEILDDDGPIPDGSNGGNSLYDVYLGAWIGASNYYGITWAECLGGAQTCQSFIELDNDYADPIFVQLGYGDNPLGAAKVTAAHEFFHAIHFSLDRNEGYFPTAADRYWWQEASSVWMEDVIFDEINDYLTSIDYFLKYPWLSLESFSTNWVTDPIRSMHPYATAIWVRFLEERFHRDIVKQIWQICGNFNGYNVLHATDQVLTDDYGSSFDEAFQEFVSWNYFIGGRADTLNKYSESHLWHDTLLTVLYTTNQVPWDTLELEYDNMDPTPEPLSCNYLVFKTTYSPPTGGLWGRFTGDPIADPRDQWRLNVLGWDDAEDTVETYDVNPFNNTGEITFKSWKNYSDVVVIPSIFGYFYEQESEGYSFIAFYDTALTDSSPIFYDFPSLIEVQSGKCAELEIYAIDPNGDAITFTSDPSADSLEILSITSTSDTSAIVEFCPGYNLVDSTIGFTMRARDDGGHYDARLLSFSVVYFGQDEADKVSLVGYPNPFSYENNRNISLRFFVPDTLDADEVELYVFSASGDLIYNTVYDAGELAWIAPGEYVIDDWDVKNNDGKQLAGGIYILKLRAGQNSAAAKIAIIR
ncbi:MAG: hypothetical protein GY839_03500 [candidate division Zixibacteria bacterium]|nr:hypothetical protein [candidate division Zixibacteria bacterium]